MRVYKCQTRWQRQQSLSASKPLFLAFEGRRRQKLQRPRKNRWWLKVKRGFFVFFNLSDSTSSPQRAEAACPVPRQPSRPKRYQKWPPAERLFDKTVSAVFGKQWGMFASSLWSRAAQPLCFVPDLLWKAWLKEAKKYKYQHKREAGGVWGFFAS